MLIVNGRSTLATYDLTIRCYTAPLRMPTLISCGGTDTGSLIGRQAIPNYSDSNEVTFYEIDGSTIPPGVTSIVIAATTTVGDCDFYLAAPDVTPGVPGMIFASWLPGLTTDGATIDATGITGPPGPWPSSTTEWNLSDYLNASTNISFAVQSWDLASSYTLTITCN